MRFVAGQCIYPAPPAASRRTLGGTVPGTEQGPPRPRRHLAGARCPARDAPFHAFRAFGPGARYRGRFLDANRGRKWPVLTVRSRGRRTARSGHKLASRLHFEEFRAQRIGPDADGSKQFESPPLRCHFTNESSHLLWRFERARKGSREGSRFDARCRRIRRLLRGVGRCRGLSAQPEDLLRSLVAEVARVVPLDHLDRRPAVVGEPLDVVARLQGRRDERVARGIELPWPN
jgi:hypothetical protein